METTIVYWGYIGIMENKMEITIVYWGYIGNSSLKRWSNRGSKQPVTEMSGAD